MSSRVRRWPCTRTADTSPGDYRVPLTSSRATRRFSVSRSASSVGRALKQMYRNSNKARRFPEKSRYTERDDFPRNYTEISQFPYFTPRHLTLIYPSVCSIAGSTGHDNCNVLRCYSVVRVSVKVQCGGLALRLAEERLKKKTTKKKIKKNTTEERRRG